jgi:hypothetical protein
MSEQDAQDRRDWVTVISPTVSDNALLRSEAVVRLLRHRFQVQHIAYGTRGDIYAPLVSDAAAQPDLYYQGASVPRWRRAVHELSAEVRGRVIVCIKPKLASFGAGLLLGRRLRLPVVPFCKACTVAIGFRTCVIWIGFSGWSIRGQISLRVWCSWGSHASTKA